jgi:hypothetical protein
LTLDEILVVKTAKVADFLKRFLTKKVYFFSQIRELFKPKFCFAYAFNQSLTVSFIEKYPF